MSYLDLPRIHIGGQFYADPSTVNNDPQHYDPANARPAPWQEPKGNHFFQLRDCTVRSALDASGPAGGDPVVGAAVTTTDLPSAAKIVDLDVYQQGVSTIYGLQLCITLRDGGTITGAMDPATLNGAWFNAVLPQRGWEQDYGWGSYGGDANASGMFQTVVRVPTASWPDTSSTVLQQLRAACAVVDGCFMLAFKFVTDGYYNVAGHSGYRLGRIVGTLGPAKVGELAQAPGPRWLVARPLPDKADWFVPTFYGAPFKIDAERKKLILDLGNSVCRQAPGGDPVDLGSFSAVVHTDPGTVFPLGAINFNSFVYANSAGITEVALTDAELELAQQNPVSLITSRSDIGPPVLLSEDPSGLAFSVDSRALRLTGDPDDPAATATTTVQVTRWGVPAAAVQLGLIIEPVYGSTPGATVPPTNPGDTPQALGVLSAPTTSISPTDANGVATVTVHALKDPGSRTAELDGQLYFLVAYNQDQPTPPVEKTAPNQEQLISCLVWSNYPINANPEWAEIQQMMRPYVKIYPGMTDRIDLSDLHTFTIFAKNPPWGPVYGEPNPEPYLGIDSGAIGFYLTRPFNDSRFMPVSRDLSPNRLKTILHFIKNLQAEQ